MPLPADALTRDAAYRQIAKMAMLFPNMRDLLGPGLREMERRLNPFTDDPAETLAQEIGRARTEEDRATREGLVSEADQWWRLRRKLEEQYQRLRVRQQSAPPSAYSRLQTLSQQKSGWMDIDTGGRDVREVFASLPQGLGTLGAAITREAERSAARMIVDPAELMPPAVAAPPRPAPDGCPLDLEPPAAIATPKDPGRDLDL